MSLLAISGLNSFYGRARALTDVSLTIEAGETVALLGRNGAGKSTLLKSIIGLLASKQGRIVYQGREIGTLAPYRISRLGIGYVPEERRIFGNLTAFENLEAGRRAARGKTRWPLERIFDVFPNLAAMRHRMGGAMSGGEQQMLSIARTLMGNPDLILLDEPSEGLAPVIVEQMARMIHALQADGLTIILSEQNMYLANTVADRAYIFESGLLRHEGTMADIAADEPLRAAYLAV
jgi:branched-chain amino acid transport system ATP-binding protein